MHVQEFVHYCNRLVDTFIILVIIVVALQPLLESSYILITTFPSYLFSNELNNFMISLNHCIDFTDQILRLQFGPEKLAFCLTLYINK